MRQLTDPTRLETRLAPSVAAPDPAVTDQLHDRITSAVEAVEGVLGAPTDVAACSLIERVARLQGSRAALRFPGGRR